MKPRSPNPNLKLSLPSTDEQSLANFLSNSGTFKYGDLLINKDGLRIVSQNEEEEGILVAPSDNHLALADFDSVKVIGKGSGGIVQLVCHKFTGQFFAVKVIQMNIVENVRKQIAQELKINQSFQCPFIVVCYQSFYDNGVISIILEYMDGGSLADFLKNVKSIPEEYLAAIAKQVLQGLVYLHHGKHIIHRDLKPSNLLINHSGEVKITDFGVSAILASTSGQRDTFIGTYSYMSVSVVSCINTVSTSSSNISCQIWWSVIFFSLSWLSRVFCQQPERIVGGTYGYKSDIWSLGIILLECATGFFPYSPPESRDKWINFYELLEEIVDHSPPCAPSDQFSPEFCSFISACVQKDPSSRKSARELLNHPFLSLYGDLMVDLASYFRISGSPLATFGTSSI